MQGHILEEWRIRDVEQKADRAVGRLYELDSLRSDVGRLEHSNRELSTALDGLRYELQAATRQIEVLQERLGHDQSN